MYVPPLGAEPYPLQLIMFLLGDEVGLLIVLFPFPTHCTPPLPLAGALPSFTPTFYSHCRGEEGRLSWKGAQQGVLRLPAVLPSRDEQAQRMRKRLAPV